MKSFMLRCACVFALAVAASSATSFNAGWELAAPAFAVLSSAWAMSLLCFGHLANTCLMEAMPRKLHDKLETILSQASRMNSCDFAAGAMAFLAFAALPVPSFVISPLSISLGNLALFTVAASAICIFKRFHWIFDIKMEIEDQACRERSEMKQRQDLADASLARKIRHYECGLQEKDEEIARLKNLLVQKR